MAEVCVVILPGVSWSERAEVAAELVGLGLRVHLCDVPEVAEELPPVIATARQVAAIAMDMNGVGLVGPVLLVCQGRTATLLPALGLAQRAVHRPVHGYVLIDSPIPAPGQDWPEAPVTWLQTQGADESVRSAALPARLRGFAVTTDADVAAEINRAAG